MANAIFVQDGCAIDYTPSTAVSAGAIVLLGGLLGVAKKDIAASALGALAIEGVYDVIKSGSSGPVFIPGDAVYWDYVNNLAVRTGGSGTVLFGTCVESAATGVAIVRTRLWPHGLPADMQDKLWEDVTLAGGSKTLDIQDTGKVMNITVGHATNVVTLPATAANDNFVIRCGTTGQRVAVSPAAADKIYGADIAGTDDKDRILAAATSLAGDYVTLWADATNGYAIMAQRGVWTSEA